MSTSPTFTRRRAGTQEDDSNSPARPSHRETVYSPRPTNSLLDLVNSESPPIYPPTMAPCQQFNSVSATQYPQFLMFGDSITEFSTLTLQPHLQTLYVRRMDVLNRGFGGYTSQTGLDVLRKFLDADLPSPPTTPRVQLMTIWFGANDACLPGNAQHVPLDRYEQALKQIVAYPVLKQHDTQIVVITPPPVNEHSFEVNPGTGKFQRMAHVTSQYALKAKDVAKSLNVPCVDVWSILMQECGWKEADGRDCCDEEDNGRAYHLPGCIKGPEKCGLLKYLHDGLHLTNDGYDMVFKELMLTIRRELSGQAPENLPYVALEWRRVLGIE